MKYLLLLLIFPLATLFGQDPIVVHLTSQSNLATFWMASEENQYGKELQKVLLFDLENNGFLQRCQSKEQADYLFNCHLKEKVFTLNLELVKESRKLTFEPLTLNGKLPEDRRQIHKLADAICKRLFSQEGIASKKILYTARQKASSDSYKWISEVWYADYDGANSLQVTKENALCVTPCFLPIKEMGQAPYFFYVSYKSGEPKIYMGCTKKHLVKRLTFLNGNQLMPAISLQHNRIAFISDVTGGVDLLIQDFSFEQGVLGKAKKLFSAPQAAQGSPNFSPDGNKIVFVSNKDGTPRLYLIDLQSKKSSPKLITRRNRENTSPCFSKDGTKIAYSAMTHGVRQIWIYDMTTGEEEQLTEGPRHKENPVWAANSLHLLYNTEMSDSCELYLINIKQRKSVKITEGPNEKRFAAWEP